MEFLESQGGAMGSDRPLEVALCAAARSGVVLGEIENIGKKATPGHIEKNHADLYSLLRQKAVSERPDRAEWVGYAFDLGYYSQREAV